MSPADEPNAPEPHRSPVFAALLSAFLPGLGHRRTRPARARALMGVSLIAVSSFAVWLVTRDRLDLLAWTIKPNWLLGVVIASFVTLVARSAVAVDAARAAGLRHSRHPLLSRLGLLVVLLLVAAPHVAVATLAWQQHNLLTRVFTAEATATARPAPVKGFSTNRSAGGTGTPASLSSRLGGARISSQALPGISSKHVDDVDAATRPAPTQPRPADESAPTTIPPSQVDPTPSIPDTPRTWDGETRLSIVMLGSDGGYDRRGIRTDTIIVLSIDVATGDAVTFSVPRNWTNVPFPAGSAAAAAYPDGTPDLANTIYGLGERRPELFAESGHPGGTAVKEAMAQTLGIPIHYFVMVDMAAVVETIDLFGGIEVNVTEYINDRIRPIEKGGPYLDITVQPGRHHFDGLTALAYVRSRVQSWDYSRMARQRCVVAALIEQVAPLDVMTNFGRFSDIVSSHVVTDIPLDRADELLAIAARMDTGRMQSFNFVPPEFPSGRVPLAKVRSAVETALSTNVTDDPSRSMPAACGTE
ncbi:MAG: LCP family protein [Acidimicrobiia bacterium]|nr:LCP family protein [Acidimicrobiia bacterium]